MATVKKTQASTLADAMFELVLHVPASKEPVQLHPAERAHAIARRAARTASVVSGSLSLPPGILGWLTVVPELMGVWKLQAQMVSDIAGVYGKSKTLGREQMLYCLFKHMSAQVFRDVVVRVGERYVVRKASSKALQLISKQLGLIVAKVVISKGPSRLVPLMGAMGAGAYAYFDTLQVAKTAVEMFERETVVDAEGEVWVDVDTHAYDGLQEKKAASRKPQTKAKRK
jgi:hypothetical protein